MSDIKKLVRSLRNMRKNGIKKIGDHVADRFEYLILELNRETLLEGTDRKGQDLEVGKRYAKKTIERKQKLGYSTHPYNLDHHSTSRYGQSHNWIYLQRIKGKPALFKIDTKWQTFHEEIKPIHPYALGLTEEAKKEAAEKIFLQVPIVLKKFFN